LVARLHAEGFIEPYRDPQRSVTILTGADSHGGVDVQDEAWRTTALGNGLANVAFTPRVRRKMAQRALREFMRRVEDVNRDDRWMLKVG